MKSITIKMTRHLLDKVMSDMKRVHEFAYERIGFLESTWKQFENDNAIIFMTGYHSIPDDQYIDDPSVGARINSEAIRTARVRTFKKQKGCFHVHYHSISFDSIPEFSDSDLKENPDIIRSFSLVSREQAHGMLLLGDKGFNALVRLPNSNELVYVDRVVIVGNPMEFSFPNNNTLIKDSDRYDRQSFLGEYSQYYIENVKVGIVGLGGGGSHIVQQLAHVGFKNYTLFDDDVIDETNLNRMVGATLKDVDDGVTKMEISERVISGLHRAEPNPILKIWQDSPEDLQQCDIVFGCVDSFMGRRDLEAECRRYLIPLIDIGMDVNRIREDLPPAMSGQVILSMPGSFCMKCMGFLTGKNLSKEAAKYGDTGGKPQVVWSNGVLASAAVGIAVQLVTGWTGKNDNAIYLSYDGNKGILKPHNRLKYVKGTCQHYPLSEIGPVVFSDI